MITEVVVPVMDQTTETVLLTRWLKREGDVVAAGDALCEIETEKATVEIEASAPGILRKQLAEAGTQIAPRTVVAYIGREDDPLPRSPVSKSTSTRQTEPSSPAVPAAAPQTATPSQPREIRISPRARRLAEDNKIDLNTVDGSGPDGRIVEDDIKAAIQRAVYTSPKIGGPGDAAATARAAKAKAERVSLSWRTIPHFHMSITANLSHLVSRKTAAPGTTYTDLFLVALAQTLPAHPALNGYWQNDTLQVVSEIRLGLVVQTERGLVIPALRDVRGRGLADIAAERELVVKQALAGTLGAAAMVEPTFTLTNVGPGHIDSFNAIISPPQVAILAVGSIMQRPVAVDGVMVICPTAMFTLGVDHRAIDGRAAQAFLEQLKTTLEG